MRLNIIKKNCLLKLGKVTEPFEGSKYLLTWADDLIEIKTICFCGKKANHVLRIDANGETVTSGQQIEIGGNDKYVSVCRKHFKESFYTKRTKDIKEI